MFIKKTVLLVSIASSIVATQNNQNPGDSASKNHPQAFLAAKAAGGAVGVFGGMLGFTAYTEPRYAKCQPLPVRFLEVLLNDDIFRKHYRFRQCMKICMIAPVMYAGWKGGQAVSKVVWGSAWSGVDKIQKLKERLKESDNHRN